MLQWIKENFEFLGALMFGAGGIYVQHQTHGKDIEALEKKQDKYTEDIAEIKGDIKTLLERTKKL